MARWKFQGTTKDQSGRILPSAIVSVYLAGTTTPASVYTSITSTTAVNSVTSDSTNATYTFYTDCFDNDYDQAFKIIINKSGYTSGTYDNIPHGEIVLGTYTISTAKTITTYVKVPKGVMYAHATGGSLSFTGPTEIGLYQVFSGFDTGDVTFGIGSVKEVVPQWWGASASATAAVNSVAFQSALSSMVSPNFFPLVVPSGTYEIDTELTKTDADGFHLKGQGWSTMLKWTGANYATMLALTGANTIGGVVIEDIRFHLNSKATTGIQLSNFGHIVTVKRVHIGYGLDNLVGGVISITDITAGVCTTANTQSIAVGNSVTFLTGAQADTGYTKWIVTAVNTNVSFTVDSAQINYASAHTAQRSSTKGMIDVTRNGETHSPRIEECWFAGGSAIGIGMGLTGASTGSAGAVITNNEFQQQNNYAIKADKLKESLISCNVVDQLWAWQNSGGFYLDVSSNLVIEGNHMEICQHPFLNINLTGDWGFKPTTARITDNLFGYEPNYPTNVPIILGYTHYVYISGNTFLGMLNRVWISQTANAIGTILGKNNYEYDFTGNVLDSELWVTADTGEPAFLVTESAVEANVTGDSAGATVTFATVVFNQGSCWDGAYTFTAPIAGKYRFSSSVLLQQLAAAHNVIRIRLVTSNRNYDKIYNFAAGANPFIGDNSVSIDVLADMDAADTAIVSVTVSGGTKIVDIYGDAGTTMSTYFCGELAKRKGFIH